jgi:thiamine-monophosphate kinase
MSFGLATLQDLGELRLIDEVVLPIAREFDLETPAGDDCAYIPSGGAVIAVTADVGPKPLLQGLPGHENDLEAAGWLAVVATASDVATAGARPLFLTNCIDAPPQLLVDDFASYLRGYFKACAAFGFRNGGGDIRHGPSLAIRVFGAGISDPFYRVGRGNVGAGDHLVVVGPAGCFMATYLITSIKADSAVGAKVLLSDTAQGTLRFPRPQLSAMATLVEQGFVVAASDTSDGLLGAIDNLRRKSRCGFELQLNDGLLPEVVKEAASLSGFDPWNIFFSWGDWSVAIAIRPDQFEGFCKVCENEQILWTHLGKATAGHREIFGKLNDRPRMKVTPIRNENFVERGFNAGLAGHLRYILETTIFSTPDITHDQ